MMKEMEKGWGMGRTSELNTINELVRDSAVNGFDAIFNSLGGRLADDGSGRKCSWSNARIFSNSR